MIFKKVLFVPPTKEETASNISRIRELWAKKASLDATIERIKAFNIYEGGYSYKELLATIKRKEELHAEQLELMAKLDSYFGSLTYDLSHVNKK
jgi:hypothetical protein